MASVRAKAQAVKANRLIGYVRVSTSKQGESGLGLEAQLAALEEYAARHNLTILAIYREVETGKISERPELQKALAEARRAGATLAVAKLDRMARRTSLLLAIVESGVSVAFLDLPHVDGPVGKFMLTSMAAVAELEAGLISDRTKKALAAAKARGVKLGSARPGHWTHQEDRRRELLAIGRRTQSLASVQAYMAIRSEIAAYRNAGLSLRQIAKKLNEQGQRTREGAEWGPVQVKRVLSRA